MRVEIRDLFRDRVPEAAAHQLALVLAHATECQLATVESLEGRKSVSKSDLRRHKEIAETLVYHCRDLNVTPRGLFGSTCLRLAERLETTDIPSQGDWE